MSQANSTTVGIAGITGKFAGLVLDNLLDNPNVRIRGYCRNASKLASRYTQSSQLEVIEGDAYDTAALNKFVQGLDVVICAYLGDQDLMINGQKALVDACDDARVPRYIASDYTLDFTKLELGQLPPKDPMKIIHEYIQGKKHIKGVHILIGAFMETFWSAYLQVWNPEEKSLAFWGNGDEMWEVTTYGDAAKYTAAIALDSNVVGFQKFLGDRQTIPGVAQTLKKVYGFEPTLKRQGPLDELYTIMHSRFKENPSNIFAWLAMFYQYYIVKNQGSIADDLDNAKYPHIKPLTVQGFLEEHDVGELTTAMENLGKRG